MVHFKLVIGVLFTAITFNKAHAQLSCQSLFPTKNNRIQFKKLYQDLRKQIKGQDEFLQKVIIALLSNGHVLIEGPTGTGKTKTVETLANLVGGSTYSKIQFTPDTMPLSLVGSEVQVDGQTKLKKGPLFANIVLADEINRATARTQSAMLEPMESRAITINGQSHKLDDVYMVLATQNPGNQIGTNALPEAQVDRFMFKLNVQYLEKQSEIDVLKQSLQKQFSGNFLAHENIPFETQVKVADIVEARKMIANVEVPQEVYEYVLSIINVTRHPEQYGSDLSGLIRTPIGTRGALSLLAAAKTTAWLKGENRVSEEHIIFLIHDVFAHRLQITEEAKIEQRDSNDILNQIIEIVKK
jgi:MoxR-like ATPase